MNITCPHCGQTHPAGTRFCAVTGNAITAAFDCPNCGETAQSNWKACPNCGHVFGDAQTRRGSKGGLKWAAWGGAALVVLVLCGLSVFLLAPVFSQKGEQQDGEVVVPRAQDTNTPITPIETASQPDDSLPTLPPPLEDVEFPGQQIPYPDEWPADLHYPESFRLVEAASGVLPEGEFTGWAAKLRFDDDPQSAADQLSAFFTELGWQIVEQTELDSGGILMLIEKGNKEGTGMLIIDPDTTNPGSSKVLTTVFP